MKAPWKWFHHPCQARVRRVGIDDPAAESPIDVATVPKLTIRRQATRQSRPLDRLLTDGASAAKQYATLSVWREEATLTAFPAAEPHRHLMRELAPEMGTTMLFAGTTSFGNSIWGEPLSRFDARH